MEVHAREQVQVLTQPAPVHRFRYVANEAVVQICAFIGGWCDAVGYSELHGIFTSSISGNLVVMAVSSITLTSYISRAMVCLVFALAGFFGALLTIVLRSRRVRAAQLALLLYSVLTLLLTAAMVIGLTFKHRIFHEGSESAPNTAVACVLATAMGWQAICVQESVRGAPNVNTLTSSLTSNGQNLAYALWFLFARYRRQSTAAPPGFESKSSASGSSPDSSNSSHEIERSALQTALSDWSLKLSMSVKPLILFIIGAILGAIAAFYTSFWALAVPALLSTFICFQTGSQVLFDTEQKHKTYLQQQRQRQRWQQQQQCSESKEEV